MFAILRHDAFQPESVPIERRVTLKCLVRDQETAEREVARLNGLHPDGSVAYWWQWARVREPHP